MTYLRTLLVAAASVACVAGCDSPGFTSKGAKSPFTGNAAGAKPVVGTTTTTGATMPTSLADQKPAFFTPGLGISDLVAKECGIQPREASNATTPTFEFDSTALQPADRDILAEVAKCLTEGALKGRAVALVGHTDLRGEPEYNMGLGDSRSVAVERYLVDLGVGKDRMRPTSRGEIDATGTDEAGMAKDRRVDIELAL